MAKLDLPPSKQLGPEDLEKLAMKTKKSLEDSEFVFLDPIPEEVEPDCSICLQVLQKPQMVSCCGHRFCLKCIDSLRSTKCPLCGEYDGVKKFLPDKRLERLIQQRKVHCSMKNDGCDWTGELCKLGDHLNFDMKGDFFGCEYLPCRCRQCEKYVRRRQLKTHMSTLCSHRPFFCEYCRTHTWHNVLEDHYRTCVNCPVVCPNIECSKPLRSHQLNQHLQECPWTQLPCEYQDVGCNEIRFRKDMEKHLRQSVGDHLVMADNKLQKLEEEVKCRGRVSFLVISDLPESALNEHKLKSRFGQFGPVDRVQLLDPELKAGIVIFRSDDTYQKAIAASREGNIKFCQEYVQANPVYTTSEEEKEEEKEELFGVASELNIS